MAQPIQSLATATESAIHLSKQSGYACIVLSQGKYYVYADTQIVRTWEELTAQYENGKLTKS